MKALVYILFLSLFLFSSLNVTGILNFDGIIMIYLMIIAFFFSFLLIKNRKINVNIPTLLAIYFYALFCAISALMNSDIISIIDFGMFLVFYVVSFIIIPKLNIQTNKVIIYTVLISHIPLILFPLIVNGINTFPYRGIMLNPNSFGLICGTIFAVLLASILGELDRFIFNNVKNRNKIIILGLLLFGTFYLIIISASRTSLLAVSVCVVIGLYSLIRLSIKQKKFFRLFSMFMPIGIVVLGLLYKFTPVYAALNNAIFNKNETRIYAGDVTAGRTYIWEKTINDAGLFGNGNDYFANNIEIGAHNTFISIIGQFGWIPSIIFLLFLIYCFFTAINHIKYSDEKYKYLPLLLVVNFFAMSMTEVMIFTLSMVAMFLSVGSINRKEILEKKPNRVRRKVVVW